MPEAVPYVVPYNAAMRKTSVYLSDEQAERLARLAADEGRSQADIVRDAIDSYRPAAPKERRLSLVGCAEGDGTPFTQETADELMKGFGA